MAKYKIVVFKDGKYAVRCGILAYYTYVDMMDVKISWSLPWNVHRACKCDSLTQAESVLRARRQLDEIYGDKGTPVEISAKPSKLKEWLAALVDVVNGWY